MKKYPTKLIGSHALSMLLLCLCHNALGQPPAEQPPAYRQPTGQPPAYRQPTGQPPAYRQPTYRQPTGQPPAYRQPTGQPSSNGAETPTVVIPEGLVNSVFIITSGQSNGTGFACTFKNKQWVATNLHVISTGLPSVKSSNGSVINLNGNMVYANDADICLLGIKGDYTKDYGIQALEFATSVVESSKTGDAVICPGNSLGHGVVTLTPGNINAYGPKKIEITNPIFQGNSGGPVIHASSHKVLGLVTEAAINKIEGNDFAKLSLNSPMSSLKEITYMAHRIDTAQKWGGCTVEQYNQAERTLEKLHNAIKDNIAYLTGKDGWEGDEKLVKYDKEYSAFLSQAYDKYDAGMRTGYRVDSYGNVLKTTTYHGTRISAAEFTSQFEKHQNRILWKLAADLKASQDLKCYGLRQTEEKGERIAWLSMIDDTVRKAK